MPPVPKIARMPADVRREFHELVRSEGFGSLEALSAWLKGRGYEIGKSAIHDYIRSNRELIEQEIAPADAEALRAKRLEVRLRVLEAAALTSSDEDVLVRADRLLEWVTRV